MLGACSSSVSIDDILPVEKVDRELYLRGDFSLWDVQPEYKFSAVTPAIYEAKVKLSTAGKNYEFKIADAQWSEGYNCGFKGEEDKVLELGKSVSADCNTVYNYFSFKAPEKGWYKVTINFSRMSSPLVTVNADN